MENIKKLNYELTKAPKKRAKNQFKGNVDIKRLLKEKTIENTNKDMYAQMLSAGFRAFEKELSKYFDGKSKIIEDQQDLVELFTNKKFSKALCRVLKEQGKGEGKIVYYAVSELWLSNIELFVEDSKLMSRYLKAFAESEKSTIKKVADLLDLNKNKTLALQLVLSSISYKQSNFKSMKSRYTAFLNQLYNMEELSKKKIVKVINLCFDQKKLGLVSFALGERPKKSENYDIVTDAILTILNSNEKDKIKETIKRLANRKKNNNNLSIRCDLTALDEKEYKHIVRVVDKLISTGMKEEYFR